MLFDRRVAVVEYERYPILKTTIGAAPMGQIFPRLSLVETDLTIGIRLKFNTWCNVPSLISRGI